MMGLSQPRIAAEHGGFPKTPPVNKQRGAADGKPTKRIATRDSRRAPRSYGSRTRQSQTTWSKTLVLLLAMRPGSCARADLLSHENSENGRATENAYDVQKATMVDEN